jgi:tryptophanyl-tRNA synthetase
LAPIRERRAQLEKNPAEVENILAAGTEAAQKKAAATLAEVRETLGL